MLIMVIVYVVDTWKKDYDKWVEDNKHMPNIPNSNVMLDKLKLQNKQKDASIQNAKSYSPRNIENRISNLERKIDKLLNHLGAR